MHMRSKVYFPYYSLFKLSNCHDKFVFVFVSNIYFTSWVMFGLEVVSGVDSLPIGFESDSSSLSLPYNERATL
jgi:hypothetical protein